MTLQTLKAVVGAVMERGQTGTLIESIHTKSTGLPKALQILNSGRHSWSHLHTVVVFKQNCILLVFLPHYQAASLSYH